MIFLRTLFLIVIANVFTGVNATAQDSIANIGIDTAVLNTIDMNAENIADEDEQAYNILEQDFIEAQQNEVGDYTRTITDSNWQKIINDKKLNYSEQIEKKVKPEKQSTSNFKISNSMGIIILYGLIALVIVLIIFAFFGKQYFKKKDVLTENATIDFENVAVYNEWEKSIKEAVSNHDYRLAIRILYLQTLQQLNDGRFINYQKETASHVYLQSIYNTRFYQPFFALTKYFEFAWYGNYKIDRGTFDKVQSEFNSFQNSIVL